jgi:hypothetical protein
LGRVRFYRENVGGPVGPRRRFRLSRLAWP